MKNFYKIAIATLTTAVMSASALAAPHDAPRDHRFNNQHPAMQVKQHDKKWQGYQAKGPQHQAPQHRAPVPPKPMHANSRAPQHQQQWQTQHKLPSMYQNSSYRVSSYKSHQLSKPERNQQWYKVNGHYLLTDTKTDRIVKIVKA